MSITSLKRPQVIDDATIAEIREILEAAERGEVTGIVFAANMADDQQYFRASDFTNGWHLLGALEYAKEAVLKGVRAE